MSESKKNYYAPMHTAEHILNGTMVKMFGCERSENCHIERKKSKCDFKLEKEPTEDEITELENRVKSVIEANHDVIEKFMSYQEASQLFNLHRINESENPEIRIISVGDYDDCPCIGEHVKNTVEIENFRITTTSFSEGIFRIRFKI
jgi:misacylated tRNA(Ala) deacylase